MRYLTVLFIALLFSHTPFAADNSGNSEETEEAYFAGGCFWCMEPPFDEQTGVISTTSGYMGGTVVDPTYDQVSSGRTGHTESVRIIYDPDKVSYEKLLDIFWHNIDPVDAGGQFCDRGNQYRSAIFTTNDQQMKLAMESYQALAESKFKNRVITTELVPAVPFYEAAERHQDYYLKNPLRYKFYRFRCGRDKRLDEIWVN